MKNLLTTLLIVLMLLAVTPSTQAQSAMPFTTLSAAVATQSQNTITVSSLTSSGASSLVMAGPTLSPGSQMMLIVDQEAMNILSVNGTTVTVARGVNRTTATGHVSAHVVWFGYTNYFHTNAPGGSCTVPVPTYLPYVTVNQDSKRVELYNCSTAEDAWIQQYNPEQVGSGYLRFCTAPVSAFSMLLTFQSAAGSGALTYNWGNNTTPVSGTQYYGTIDLPRTMLVTGLSLLQGSVAGTDKYILAVHRSDGVTVATTPVAGVAAGGGAGTFQDIPFASQYILTGPARYWLDVQVNGTTTRFVTDPVSGAGQAAFTGRLGSSFTGTFGTITSLTAGPAGSNPATTALPTSLIANTSPMMCVY